MHGDVKKKIDSLPFILTLYRYYSTRDLILIHVKNYFSPWEENVNV